MLLNTHNLFLTLDRNYTQANQNNKLELTLHHYASAYFNIFNRYLENTNRLLCCNPHKCDSQIQRWDAKSFF